MTGAVALRLAVGVLLPLALAQVIPPDTSARRGPTVSVRVVPETVTVGDRFRSYLRVSLPPGMRVTFPEVASGDSLEAVDSVRIASSGDSLTVAAYTLVAWVADEPLRQPVAMELIPASGPRRRVTVSLKLPVVRSVLPSEGEVRPRPPKGLLPIPSRDRGWWPWLLLVALLLVAAGALFWYHRRKRSPVVSPDPRVLALSQLEQIRRSRTATGSADEYYTAITRVLRQYLARVDARWGEDLTTSEVLARVRESSASPVDAPSLANLMSAADPVKFGGVIPTSPDVDRFLRAVWEWVEANPRAVAPEREAA